MIHKRLAIDCTNLCKNGWKKKISEEEEEETLSDNENASD